MLEYVPTETQRGQQNQLSFFFRLVEFLNCMLLNIISSSSWSDHPEQKSSCNLLLLCSDQQWLITFLVSFRYLICLFQIILFYFVHLNDFDKMKCISNAILKRILPLDFYQKWITKRVPVSQILHNFTQV